MAVYFAVGLAAFVVSGLTLYSGFGLGTLLMPVFAIFFPVEVAVAATAVVHFGSNIFKIFVVGRSAEKSVVLRFGIPAIVAAFFGAMLLGWVSGFGEIYRYSIGYKDAVITPIKLVMSVLMLIFAIFELLPALRDVRFSSRYLFLGGILSGFFGGLSGHQGALRSAFLVKTGISTESFVGTNAVIGFLVDSVRVVTYAVMLFFIQGGHPITSRELPVICVGMAAAFAGVMLGKRYLKKIRMEPVQTLTGAMLLIIAAALGAGVI